jgi:integrase
MLGFSGWRVSTGCRSCGFRTHAIRAASIALESGIDIKVVSNQLGHSTTRITHDLYLHVVRRLHDEAAERVAASVDLL